MEERLWLKEHVGGVDYTKIRGMGVVTTTIFAVGEMAGSGVLALPAAMSQTGWIGFVLVAICAFVSGYTGSILGKCWMMVQQRFVEYQHHPRYPYPAIGQVAYGRVVRVMISLFINMTMFGSSVVFLLLASENIQDLVANFDSSLSYCYWLIIVAACLCPISWFGTPKDFWPIAITAAIATAVACALIVINTIVDAPDVPETYHGPISMTGFLTAIGTIFFAYGGHPVFPTIQTDMREPHKFGRAINCAYFLLLLMYIPVGMSGYFVFGSNIDDNVLNTLSQGPMRTIALILVTTHLFAAYVIIINPVCQEGEELLGIPYKFGIRRILFRTAVTGLVLFTALSVPQFGNILSLIGGSTQTALCLIFPPSLYLKLCSMKGEWETVHVPLHEKVACVEIIAVGVFIVIAATYSAMTALVSSELSGPCYL